MAPEGFIEGLLKTKEGKIIRNQTFDDIFVYEEEVRRINEIQKLYWKDSKRATFKGLKDCVDLNATTNIEGKVAVKIFHYNKKTFVEEDIEGNPVTYDSNGDIRHVDSSDNESDSNCSIVQ